MSVQLPDKTRNALAITMRELFVSFIGTTPFASGLIQIYDGSMPSSPNDPVPGGSTELAQFDIFSSSFSVPPTSSEVGLVELINPLLDIDIDATGTASWFRVVNRTQPTRETILQGTITLEGGGGDLEFDDVSFIEGRTAVIKVFNVQIPEICEVTESASV